MRMGDRRAKNQESLKKSGASNINVALQLNLDKHDKLCIGRQNNGTALKIGK
jgi:hypothetical protein